MLFNSFQFLVFFIAVVFFYYLLPHRFRWILLLAASYYFYMVWKPALIVLIVFSTFINYILSLAIERERQERKRKHFLLASIFINFGLLFIFKYLVFLNQSIMGLFMKTGVTYPIPDFDIILPMGISFYTFQAASYTIDVYRKKIKPIRHYGIFSLYITFFPQLVAGPIERSENLLPQFYQKHRFRLKRMVMGFKIMLLGFFKKIVIADRVAMLVNTVYASPEQYGGLAFIIATVLFAFQIYCDFSGYSDIALGAARVLGFQLMKNFENPFLSKSIKEHWRRWHISLSSWFMDYVYIPLGGNRGGKWKAYRNTMITFLVSGLWHGSNWTYVIWGGIHGFYQVTGSITSEIRNRIKQFFHVENSRLVSGCSVLFTFGLICFAFIFFRSKNLEQAIYIIRHLFSDVSLWSNKQYLYELITGMGVQLTELIVICGAILFLMTMEVISGKRQVYEMIEKKNLLVRLAFYVFVASAVLTLGVYYNAGEFIYFQF